MFQHSMKSRWSAIWVFMYKLDIFVLGQVVSFINTFLLVLWEGQSGLLEVNGKLKFHGENEYEDVGFGSSESMYRLISNYRLNSIVESRRIEDIHHSIFR